MRRKNNLGLAIFLIILSIFYYEISYKTQELKKEVILNIEGKDFSPETLEGKETKIFETEKVDLLKIKLERGKLVFAKDHSLKKIKIKINGNNLSNVKIQRSVENGVKIAEINLKENISGAYLKVISPEKIDLAITNINGEEIIKEAKNISINDNYSNIKILNSDKVNINTTYGTIKIQKIKKDVSINTKYSKLVIQDVKGNVKITDDYGDKIVIDKIGGNLSIDTKYTPLYITTVKGESQIKNRYSDKILLSDFSTVSIETKYSTIISNRGKNLSLTGKENNLKCQSIKVLTLAGKHNKISGVMDNLIVDGKYDTIAVTVKGGKIKESSGDLNLKIPELVDDFNIEIIDTPLFVKINNLNNTYFKIESTEGSLDSNFLIMKKDKGSKIEATFGEKGMKNKFFLTAKFSNITIYN